MQQNTKPAYLIIRQGARWTDVFRMDATRPLIAGRASSNEIPIADERSSRRHAEFFFENGWFVRDLGSRNGTWIDGVKIDSAQRLSPGQVISIASCKMTFSDSLESVAPVSNYEKPGNSGQTQDQFGQSSSGRTGVHSNGLNESITYRRSKSEILDPASLNRNTVTGDDNQEIAPKPNSRFTRSNDYSLLREGSDDAVPPARIFPAQALLHLAFQLAKESDLSRGCDSALARLAADTNGSAFGILAFERTISPSPPKSSEPDRTETSGSWRILATMQKSAKPYHAPDSLLVNRVYQEREAVLVHDSRLDGKNIGQPANRVSTELQPEGNSELLSESVRTSILAPIRFEDECLGVIHLYNRFSEPDLQPHDLEIALALADVVGTFFANVEQLKKLESKLQSTTSRVSELEQRLAQSEEWVGQSESLKQIQEQVARISRTKATVLLRGESGVGKEIVARKIHETSPCAAGPFVALNCAALSPTLLESELFGHEKGAFTGATERKLGKFEQAHKGTLMLDELGEMSLETQSKFLRVLEGSSFERVGGNKPIQVDVRVIAATNKDLEAAVAAGEFRFDLYFRLRIIELRISPLRERPEDIVLIAEHYLKMFWKRAGAGPTAFSPRAIAAMQSYAWPGNIRELRNAVERAHVLGSGALAEPEDLALSNLRLPGMESTISPQIPGNGVLEYVERTLDDVETEHIEATLKHTGGQKNRAAAILGIERSTLDRKLKRMKSDIG